MYGPERKERFIRWYQPGKHRRESMYATFAMTEDLESRLSRDLAQLDMAEAKALMESLEFYSLRDLRLALDNCKEYASWCRSNGLFPASPGGFLLLRPGQVDPAPTIARTAFRSAGDLIAVLRSVRVWDRGYPEPPVLALAWLGLTQEEILSLKEEDVDLDRETVTVGGRVAADGFPPELRPVLRACGAWDQAERDGPCGPYPVFRDRASPYFLKRMLPEGPSGNAGKPYGVSQISKAIAAMNRELAAAGKPPRLRFDAVWLSGRCRRLWEAEQAGADVTDPACRDLTERIFRRSMGFRKAIRLYEAYKRAFRL